MGTIIDIILFILFSLFVIIMLGSIIIAFKYVVWFHWRQCNHCGHIMKYMGLKESEKGHCYFFHCEHCGSWEQIPMEKFVQDIDKDCNPNVV